MKIGRLAPYYRWIEYCAFGRALERQRFVFLDRVAAAKRILILGEGDGRVLSSLLKLAPQAQIDVVEISPEMIGLARRRIGSSGHVRFICGDARTAELQSPGYDAVLTMFFLDCFSEQDAADLIRRIASAMEARAIWLISEFTIPDRGWRRLHARIWIGTMYAFFGAATRLNVRSLPPIAELLSAAGMSRIDRKEARAGLMTTDLLVKVID